MSIEKAKEELDNAMMIVARAAQEVADTAEYSNHKTGGPLYLVGLEDMDDLKKAIKEWKRASADFLLEVQKGSS